MRGSRARKICLPELRARAIYFALCVVLRLIVCLLSNSLLHVMALYNGGQLTLNMRYLDPDKLGNSILPLNQMKISGRDIADKITELPCYFWKPGKAYRGHNVGDDLNVDLCYALFCPNNRTSQKSKRVDFITTNRNRRKILLVGSVLNHIHPGDIVAGVGFYDFQKSQPIEQAMKHGLTSIVAVRGPVTCQNLKKLGYACPKVFVDPALLASAILWPGLKREVVQHPICVVPHGKDSKVFAYVTNNPNLKLVEPSTHPPLAFVKQLLKCGIVVSSSLHGIILADSFEVPSYWLHGPMTQQRPDKFVDYFLTVGRNTTAFVRTIEEASQTSALPLISRSFINQMAKCYINALSDALTSNSLRVC